MKKVLIICMIVISTKGYGQEIMREYYNNFLVQYEWQVDANGVKNGYFRSYSSAGNLYEAGTYKSGLKSGTWTTYGIMEGHPSEISSTMEYKDGKMDGRYVQYCWSNNKRYICGDRTYREDQEITALTYHRNGQLAIRIDRDKNIYDEWFEDGQPKIVTIDGRQYEYYEDGDGYRSVTDLYYDTLGLVVHITYPFYGRVRNIDFREQSSKCRSCGDFVIGYDFNNFYKPEITNSEGVVPLDSANLRHAFEAYIKIPDPNKAKKPCPYDFKTGDLKETNSHGYTLSHMNAQGKIVFTSDYNEQGELVYSVDQFGNTSSYTKGVLTEQEAADRLWIKTFYANGKIQTEESKSRNNPYIKKYYQTGNIELELGYVNGLKRKPVHKHYYESGRLKWSLEALSSDSTQLNKFGYELSDTEKQEYIGIVRFNDWDFTEPNKESTRDIEVVHQMLIKDYRQGFANINNKIVEQLSKSVNISNNDLVNEKLMKVVEKNEAIVKYAVDFAAIDQAYRIVVHIQESIDSIVVPTSEEDIKKLKKSKEMDEILSALGIPMI